MPRRRKLAKGPAPQLPAKTATGAATGPAIRTRRKVKSGGDPRVMQFREPEARQRVLDAIALQPSLEVSAFSHRPWFRGYGLDAEEAQRVMQAKTIIVAGICYTKTKRVVCNECTYEKHKRLKTEGWDQPIYEGGSGLFTCSVCKDEFVGDLRKWPP